MKSVLLTILIILLPVSVLAEGLEGNWEINVVPEGKEQFPWWQQIKYPTKLVITRESDVYTFKFTDQYDFTCSGTAMSANKNREIVFEFCSKLGTKHDIAWGPIHHAKLVDGKLQGVVTSSQYLFKWVGNRVK